MCCHAHSALATQFAVTSLLRPQREQPRNASPLSVHPAGVAVDLRVPPLVCRQWLRDTLSRWERERIVEATRKQGGCLIVTADHGNFERMIDPDTGKPHTAHTTFDVPLIVVDDELKNMKLRTDGRLADIAPTLLAMMGLALPAEMEGTPLFAQPLPAALETAKASSGS